VRVLITLARNNSGSFLANRSEKNPMFILVVSVYQIDLFFYCSRMDNVCIHFYNNIRASINILR